MRPTDYPPLNLPAAELKLKPSVSADRPMVYDEQRARWVTLTPEEWVRQHFVAMLINSGRCLSSRIANEVSLQLNSTARRCDTVVYDRYMSPLMIVEYKAPSVRITQDVFDQIARYNMVLRARYLVVSNGLSHYCCELNPEAGSYRFIPDVPFLTKQ